jgi:predicted transposase YbfD/YdcC
LKKNQPKLYRQVVGSSESSPLLDEHYMQEKNRGRTEMRRLEVYPFPDQADPAWQNMNVVIKLTRTGIRKGKPYENRNFYISTLCDEAETFQEYIRGYWGIENKVHYVKDVVFKQDGNRLTRGNMPANVGIINGACLSILRRKGGDGITLTRQDLANNIEKLCNFLE